MSSFRTTAVSNDVNEGKSLLIAQGPKGGVEFAQRKDTTSTQNLLQNQTGTAVSVAFSNIKLKDLLEMPISPFIMTPAPGTYRCFICWESSTVRDEFIVPCSCKNESLKYVS